MAGRTRRKNRVSGATAGGHGPSKIGDPPGGEAISKAFETNRAEFSVSSEKAVLVSVALPGRPWATNDPCDEIRGLTESAGAEVVACACLIWLIALYPLSAVWH